MEDHIHGLLVNRFVVHLFYGPFDGLTVEVAGCCAAPWLFYVSETPAGPVAWHPEEVAPRIDGAEEYLRTVDHLHPQFVIAVHLPFRPRLAGTA